MRVERTLSTSGAWVVVQDDQVLSAHMDLESAQKACQSRTQTTCQFCLQAACDFSAAHHAD